MLCAQFYTTMDKVQKFLWYKLSEMSGEDVLRALVNWHGMDLLDEDFYKNLVNEEIISDDLGLLEEDEEEEEDEDDY